MRALSPGFSAERYPMLLRDRHFCSPIRLSRKDHGAVLTTADLKQQRRLTFTIDQSHAMLSRDNTQVLFSQSYSAKSQRTEIVLMEVDGSRRNVLTSQEDVFGAIPVFAPSDRQIAYH